MKPFSLFIDTETTGIPKRWDLDYSETDNWPSAIQISWIIFDEHHSIAKRETHFVDVKEIKIDLESFKIHKISKDFLRKEGKKRNFVLQKLSNDILTYNPIIVGHFLEFDLHVLGCDFYREKLKNPFLDSRFFCTMLKSKCYSCNPKHQYFKLKELCNYLFDNQDVDYHKANIDVEMTAKCYFEMLSRKEISDKEFSKIHDKIKQELKFSNSY